MNFRDTIKAFGLFFMTSQKERDQRFDDFIALVQEIVDKIPKRIRAGMNTIHPTLTNSGQWDWSEKDIQWWKEKYHNDPYVVFKKLDVLESEVRQELIALAIKESRLLGKEGSDMLMKLAQEITK